MPEPAVSVLLPAYNAQATLAATLDSLLSQSFRDFEIVAVDDGSTDGTGEILRTFALTDERVRPFPIAHGGIVAALNEGLAQVRGRYVARMDADDLCHPDRLASQAAALDENPDLGLVACRVCFGGDRHECGGYARYVDWINGLLTPDDIALGRFRESPLAHPSVMFRADVPREHGGYRDGPFPEDYELWLRWLEAGVRMAKLPDELLTWTDSPGRLSRTHDNYSVDNFYRIKTEYLARWLTENNPHHPDVWLVGAGRVSRLRSELLTEYGVSIRGYIDIDPRKIGNIIHGRPIVPRSEAPAPGAGFILSYVANHGADAEIRKWLTPLGYREGRDFLFAA